MLFKGVEGFSVQLLVSYIDKGYSGILLLEPLALQVSPYREGVSWNRGDKEVPGPGPGFSHFSLAFVPDPLRIFQCKKTISGPMRKEGFFLSLLLTWRLPIRRSGWWCQCRLMSERPLLDLGAKRVHWAVLCWCVPDGSTISPVPPSVGWEPAACSGAEPKPAHLLSTHRALLRLSLPPLGV